MREKYEDLQGLTIISALIFILAVPAFILSIELENTIEFAVFLATVVLTVKYYRANLKIYSALFGLLVFAYNPIFWILNNGNSFAALDIMAALGSFLIALSLQKQMDINNLTSQVQKLKDKNIQVS